MRKQYITFECQHQKISRTDDFYVVGGSQKYLYAKFSFCEDWEGERQYAVFTGGGNTYRVEIVNGECEVPWEVLLTKRFFVGCEAGQRITSNAAEVVVHPCGAPEETDTPRKPTPTLQSQIGELEELDTEHKENLVSAINELDDKLEAKASWGQNDPTKPDHIKDRTHWVENGALTPLPVAGKWVDDNNDGVNDTFYFSAPVGLEVGKTYTVNWNGTSYEVVCQDIATIEGVTISGLFLGNPAVAGISEASTDEPFLVVEFSSEDATQMKSFGLIGGLDKAEVPFAIYTNGEVVHKLDSKFLDLDWLPKIAGNALIKEQTVHCVQSGDLIIGEVTLDKAFDFPVGSKVPLIAVINGAVFKAFGTSDLDTNTINVDDTFGFGGVSRWWWFSPPVAGTYTVAVYESNENIIPDEFLPERLQSENVVPRSGGNFLGSLATRDVYVGGAKDAYGNWSPRGARIVDHTPLDVSIKNEMYISTMQIREAGEYFLILPEGSNYLYGMQIGEADLIRHFDVSQMPEIPAGTYPDYYPYQVGQDIYVNFGSKTRVDPSEKAFDDGYQFQKRLNFQSKTVYVDDDTDRPYPAVQFTVSGPAVVRIWWVAGGDGRYFAIQSREGSGASRLEVSGTLNVHGRQYMNGSTLDMGGGDIVDVQSITTHGSAYIGNKATVKNSLEVGSELQVGGPLTMTSGSTFNANGGDIKGAQTITVRGTSTLGGDVKIKNNANRDYTVKLRDVLNEALDYDFKSRVYVNEMPGATFTEKLQNAVDAVDDGGVVCIPFGEYALDTRIFVPAKNVKLLGIGKERPIINFAKSAVHFAIDGVASDDETASTGFAMERLIVNCSSNNPAAVVEHFRMDYAGDFRIIDCQFNNTNVFMRSSGTIDGDIIILRSEINGTNDWANIYVGDVINIIIVDSYLDGGNSSDGGTANIVANAKNVRLENCHIVGYSHVFEPGEGTESLTAINCIVDVYDEPRLLGNYESRISSVVAIGGSFGMQLNANTRRGMSQAVTQANLESALGSYITDVAALVGGDA